MFQIWSAEKHDEMRRKFNREFDQGKKNIAPFDTRWWIIHVENPDRNDVPRIIGNIRYFARWAFVYCYPENNISHLRGLIGFEERETGESMAFNIYKYAEYEPTWDDPNTYRGLVLNFEPLEHPHNWRVLFDSGPYNGNPPL
jgi:hypothetical protein